MQSYTDRQMYRHTETDIDTERKTYSQKGRQTDIHINHTNRPDRQTDRQTGTLIYKVYIYIHIYIYIYISLFRDRITTLAIVFCARCSASKFADDIPT